MQVLSSQSIASSSRAVRLCSPWRARWIQHWRKTWSTVCSSAPHSHAVEEASPHLCKQEWNSRCSWEGHSEKVGVSVGDESTESRSAVQPLHIPLVIRPPRRTSVFVRWTGELFAAGRFPDLRRSAFALGEQVSAERSRCPDSTAWRARDSVAPLPLEIV